MQDFNTYVDSLGEDYAFLDRFAKRTGELAGVKLEDLTEIPFGTLKEELPQRFEDGDMEGAILLLLATKKKKLTLGMVKRLRNKDKFLFLLWVKDQLKKLGQLEAQYLSAPPDPKKVAAGISELDALGAINTVDLLAQGDILKWNQIRALPYGQVFEKLLKSTIEARINQRLKK